MKHLCRLFLTLSLLVCLVPFAGMSLRPTVESAENRVLSAFPSFTKRDGRVNIAFFQQFDTWFSEHFAFRNELVFLDSVVQSDIFHSSANEKVIVGRDGWLYYASTLPDYQGTGLVSEREICSMAHNLKLTERFVREHGAKLLLAFPANKNTLYGDFMPWYCPAPDGTAHNLFRLQDRLAALGLPYADLHGLFSKEPEILYHRQDSHWNSKGAMLAYTLMMDRLSLPHEDFAALPVTRALTHEGDLGRMLYTFYGKKGADYAYALDGRYEIVEAAGQTGDGWIETAGTVGRGTLLMFRDSFTDALLPFFASSFKTAYFTKEQPYGLETLLERCAPDAVIFEKAERNLPDYLDMPPLFSAPEAELPEAAEAPREGTELSLRTLENDTDYYCLSGTAAGELKPEDVIYAELNGRVYECFHTRANGFLLYLKKTALPEGTAEARVLVESGGTVTAVWSGTVREE